MSDGWKYWLFPSAFLGHNIMFEETSGINRTISEKLSQMFVHYDSRDYGATSYAWATFIVL